MNSYLEKYELKSHYYIPSIMTTIKRNTKQINKCREMLNTFKHIQLLEYLSMFGWKLNLYRKC